MSDTSKQQPNNIPPAKYKNLLRFVRQKCKSPAEAYLAGVEDCLHHITISCGDPAKSLEFRKNLLMSMGVHPDKLKEYCNE